MIKLAVFFFLLIHFSITWAKLPVDIVFDIDLTIVTQLHDGPFGDLLGDPNNPLKDTVLITHADNPLPERYRIYEGMIELMEELKERQRLGQVRISFFSGGTQNRNFALLDAIKLKDGSSLKSLASSSTTRIFSRNHMTPTRSWFRKRIRDRFKKDLLNINKDLSDLIIIDDIKEFVPASQADNMFWIGENFPYLDRLRGRAPYHPHPDLLMAEKNKYVWIRKNLFEALEQRSMGEKPLSKIIQELTKHNRITPSTGVCDLPKIPRLFQMLMER